MQAEAADAQRYLETPKNDMIDLWHFIRNISATQVKDVLVSIPGVVLGLFSFYFAYQKIGHKVIASYAFGWDRITEERITEIVFINKKNKPESIFSIQAVINEDVVIEVERFKPPLLLKPLESVHVKTTPFSALYIDNHRFHAEYHNAKTLSIYLITHNKKLKGTLGTLLKY